MLIKKKYLPFIIMIILIISAGQANAVCPENTTSVPVRGEIFDNPVSHGTTLGIVRFLGKNSKLDCAIMGNGGAGPDGSINFIHTLFCADKVKAKNNNETTHSQLILSTSGSGEFHACNPENHNAGIYGSFNEISTPISGRGFFHGVTNGKLVIDGSINCQHAIDMRFEGEICLPNIE